MLADPRIAKYGDGMAPIKSKVMLSCEECMYKTNYLPWKIVNRRMRDHKRKHHRKDHNDNPVEALIADLAEDTQQKTDMGKGPKPIQNSDLEIATSKTTGEENSMKGYETRPGDKLVAEVDYPNAQILASLSTMSSPSCTSEILCWSPQIYDSAGGMGVPRIFLLLLESFYFC